MEVSRKNKRIYGGVFTKQFEDDCSSEERFNLYTLLEMSGDGQTWKISLNSLTYITNYVTPDDYAILPPLRLTTGKVYEISFNPSTLYSKENLAVYIGKEPTKEGMQKELIPLTEYNTKYSGIVVSHRFCVVVYSDFSLVFSVFLTKVLGCPLCYADLKIQKASLMPAPNR